MFLICQLSNQSRHLIIVIIIVIIFIIVVAATEGNYLRALAELHVSVAQGCETLKQNLLTSDLLLAGHLTHLAEIN